MLHKPNSAVIIETAFNEYKPALLRYLTRLVGSSLGEDLLQESFARALAGQSNFRGQASVKNWLFRIAGNLACDILRKRGNSAHQHTEIRGTVSGLELDESGAFVDIIDDRTWNLPNEQTDRNEMIACISEFINNLQPTFRTIIILREMDHFEIDDIAEIVDISAENVRVRIHRAREALRKTLAQGCHIYQSRSGFLCEKL